MTVYLYARCSAEENFNKGSSVETQITKCNAYAIGAHAHMHTHVHMCAAIELCVCAVCVSIRVPGRYYGRSCMDIRTVHIPAGGRGARSARRDLAPAPLST